MLIDVLYYSLSKAWLDKQVPKESVVDRFLEVYLLFKHNEWCLHQRVYSSNLLKARKVQQEFQDFRLYSVVRWGPRTHRQLVPCKLVIVRVELGVGVQPLEYLSLQALVLMVVDQLGQI